MMAGLQKSVHRREEASMLLDKHLEALVDAGWHVIDTDFDATAVLTWRREAFQCLNLLVGPEHACTQHFEHYLE